MMSSSYNPTSLQPQQQQQQLDVPNLHHQPNAPPQQQTHITTTTTSQGNLLGSSATAAAASSLVNYLGAEAAQLQQISNVSNALAYERAPLHLAPGGASGGLVEKTFYTTSPPHGIATATANRFYTAATSTAPQQPNTILITNSYAQQAAAHPQHQRLLNAGGLRLFAAPPSGAATAANGDNGGQQHLIINNNHSLVDKESHATTATAIPLHHLWPQQQAIAMQQAASTQPQFLQQQASLSSAPTHTTMQLQLAHSGAPPHTHHFYVTTSGGGGGGGGAVQPQATTAAMSITGDVSTTTATGHAMGNEALMLPAASGSSTMSAAAPSTTTANKLPTAGGTSTVVLDRINICINNHYTDSSLSGHSPVASLSSSEPQSSPNIPVIQHKPVMDLENALAYAASPQESQESLVIILDEPDSTTTTTAPHTPPTTPDAIESPTSSSSLSSRVATTTDSTNRPTSNEPNAPDAGRDDKKPEGEGDQKEATNTEADAEVVEVEDEPEPAAKKPKLDSPLTPPTSTVASPSSNSVQFDMGEDVLIKRQDGRFYLGTVMKRAHDHYLVRFDDKSELWSKGDEMRKLGGGKAAEDNSESGPMCLACKRPQRNDVVETCERCGRGYHRSCTSETSPGSGEWMCKRCWRPMKVQKTLPAKAKRGVCRKLPYTVESLTWDEKHRVNQERTYCYCAEAGEFDRMLQCCKCLNWYHTRCIQQKLKFPMMRGDCFFVFCCSACNDGEEFLRRLQMTWVGLAHLVLYNLADRLKGRNLKYHHFIRDILPYILEKRKEMWIPNEWEAMDDNEFSEKLKNTYKEHTEHFIGGRETKRDPFYFGLRNVGPPVMPSFKVQRNDVLSDEFLTKTLKLSLLKDTTCQKSPKALAADVYEFHSNGEDTGDDDKWVDIDDDDAKFTSDDEIPIKLIMEQTKKSLTTPTKKDKPSESSRATSSASSSASSSLSCSPRSSNPLKKQQFDLDDECANDAKTDLPLTPTKHATALMPHKTVAEANADVAQLETAILQPPRNSRKRKAFTLSKSYKEQATEAAGKRYEANGSRVCDSSSDENSSSSRGTSLDFIIPPPKNFLGDNNPFRMISPKKASGPAGGASTSNGRGRPSSKNAHRGSGGPLDFGSKLAALKNGAGGGKAAAGQPRMLRTIKRRLSAKDIVIGPNQEVRRRRNRPHSSNVEVISTTPLQALPHNFFAATTCPSSSKYAKDSPRSMSQASSSSAASTSSASSTSCSSKTNVTLNSPPSTSLASMLVQEQASLYGGRRLRQRPQKPVTNASPPHNNSGSNLMNPPLPVMASSASSTSTHRETLSSQDLSKYFGLKDRLERESYKICARRKLLNGEVQYLIEWGRSDNDAISISSSDDEDEFVDAEGFPEEAMQVDCEKDKDTKAKQESETKRQEDVTKEQNSDKEIQEDDTTLLNDAKGLQDGDKKLQDSEKKIQDGDKILQDGEKKLQDGDEKLQDGDKKLQEVDKKLNVDENNLQDGAQKSQEGVKKSQGGDKASQDDVCNPSKRENISRSLEKDILQDAKQPNKEIRKDEMKESDSKEANQKEIVEKKDEKSQTNTAQETETKENCLKQKALEEQTAPDLIKVEEKKEETTNEVKSALEKTVPDESTKIKEEGKATSKFSDSEIASSATVSTLPKEGDNREPDEPASSSVNQPDVVTPQRDTTPPASTKVNDTATGSPSITSSTDVGQSDDDDDSNSANSKQISGKETEVIK